MQSQNKASFFKVEFEFSELEIGDFVTSNEISNRMDLVLQLINASEEIYRFTTENKIIYLFSTESRKREGQLLKFVNKHVYKTRIQDAMSRPIIKALLKKKFYELIEGFKKDRTLNNTEVPDQFPNYNGEDLQILENPENWHEWQVQLYKKLFYASGELKPAPPEDRKIIFLYDPKGCSGKSTFFKWLFWKHSSLIGYLTVGSASQLRSAVCKIPYKSIYLCDLARSTGSQDTSRLVDLMSLVEELKTGAIVNVMYGKHDLILQNKSHIIVSSNFLVDPASLSKDRLQILKITNNGTLTDITRKTIKHFNKVKAEKKQVKVGL